MNQARVKAAWQGHGLEVSPGWPVAYNQAPSVFRFGHLRNENRNMRVKRFILKSPWLLLNIVVSCHAPHIVEFHLWAHFVVIFSRKFLDGRVEERADFLTPLSLPGMSRIENNWGCLAQIGEIATTFGIVALWPILALFSWRGSLSRGFFKRFRSKKRRLRWMKKVSSAFYMQHTFVAAYALHPEYRTA